MSLSLLPLIVSCLFGSAISAPDPSAVAAGGAKPVACVLEYTDQWTKSAHAAERLAEAGFRVSSLPLDRSPLELDADLIFIGSFACEHPGYTDYMGRYGRDLLEFVSQGRVLIQMTQADQVEAEPPFLPASLGAIRCDRDFESAFVINPRSRLLADVELGKDGLLRFDSTRTIWEAFVHQAGFEVVLAGDRYAQNPALMEGALGRGRIILAAMSIDKADDSADGNDADGVAADGDGAALVETRQAFRRTFFKNLASHAVNVRSGQTERLEVTPTPLKVRDYVPGSWTLAVLPDTQLYSLYHPGLFFAQTGWIVKNRDRLAIEYVVQLGDTVHTNTHREWRNARDAMSLLDGAVPYAIAPGNHDYGPGGSAATRDTLFNEYFPFDAISVWPTFGGAMIDGRLDNTYHLFDAGGRKWIIVALEWAPRNETVAWANRVMEKHADRTGILITHAYMNNNDQRYDHTDTQNPQRYNPHLYKTPGTKNDGTELWDKLVSRHNFAFALNGHVLGDGAGYMAAKNDRGKTCHQILANFQMRKLGGEAYMRLLEFHPDGRTVQVKTYSPLYDSYLLEPDQQFQLIID